MLAWLAEAAIVALVTAALCGLAVWAEHLYIVYVRDRHYHRRKGGKMRSITICLTLVVLLAVVVPPLSASATPEANWVLVHGAFGGPWEWQLGKWFMTIWGIPAEMIYTPQLHAINPVQQVYDLATYLNDLDLWHVEAVCHSQGGLTAAYLVQWSHWLRLGQPVEDLPPDWADAVREAGPRIVAIHAMHTPFEYFPGAWPDVPDLVRVVAYGSARHGMACCEPPYTHQLCQPDTDNDGLVRYDHMWLEGAENRERLGYAFCHSEARKRPHYFVEIIFNR